MSELFSPSRRRALGQLGTGAALVAVPTLILPRRARAAPALRLTVLHTNDTHSRMEPFENGPHQGKGGVARRATLIRRARADNPNTFVFDGGDTFQGTPWFNEFKGTIDIQAMRAMGYDATAMGNHDFDAGVEQLRDNLALAPHLAALTANFVVAKGSVLDGRIEPHRVYERGGRKIGVFGLGVRFEGLVNPRLHVGVTYKDPIEAAREQVGGLRDQGCDVVIALSHLGYKGYSGEPGDLDWPKEVAGVDYVVGGHTHTFLKEPTLVVHRSGWRTPVMQVGHSGLNLGRAEIVVDARGRAEVAMAAPLGIGGAAVV
jgi:5'-nucleotidase